MAKKTLAAASLAKLETNTAASQEELAMDQALWETSFDAVVVTDRIGLIRHVNSTAIEEFGYASANEIIGNNVSILVGGGLAHQHHDFMERFNKNEKTSSTIGKQRKLQARRKDGKEFDCIIGIKEIPSTSLLVGYIRIEKNIRGVQQEKDTHMSASECHVEVDDTSFDSIVVIDPRGMILNVNLTALGEFGYGSKSELIGENIHILVGGDGADNHDAYLANFDSDGRDSSTIGNQRVLHAKRKDGNEFPCVKGIKRSPNSDSLIGYIRNMTGISPEANALKEKTKYRRIVVRFHYRDG